jgi:hypothetical protein
MLISSLFSIAVTPAKAVAPPICSSSGLASDWDFSNLTRANIGSTTCRNLEYFKEIS